MTDAATASSRTMKGRNMVVVFFSRAGENYEVGEVTVGNTAKLAQEVARRTDSPMIEIARTEPYPERYAATSEMVQEEQRVNARPLFTLSGDVDALLSSTLTRAPRRNSSRTISAKPMKQATPIGKPGSP